MSSGPTSAFLSEANLHSLGPRSSWPPISDYGDNVGPAALAQIRSIIADLLDIP